MKPAEKGPMGGVGPRVWVWTGQLEKSVSHPSGGADGFLRSPVFRGHSSISVNNGLNLSSCTLSQDESFSVLCLVFMSFPKECLLLCPHPYRSHLVLCRH